MHKEYQSQSNTKDDVDVDDEVQRAALAAAGIGVIDLPLGAFFSLKRDSAVEDGSDEDSVNAKKDGPVSFPRGLPRRPNRVVRAVDFQYPQSMGGSHGILRTSWFSHDGTLGKSTRSMISAASRPSPKRRTVFPGGCTRGMGSVEEYRLRRRRSLAKVQSKSNLKGALAGSSDDEDEYDPVNNERNNLWEEEDFRDSISFKMGEIDDDLSTLAPGSVKSKNNEESKVSTDAMGYSGLHRLCNAPREGSADPRWELVRNYLLNLSIQPDLVEKEMETTQREGHEYAPIHVACMLSPPLDVVEEMIRLCPGSLEMVTANGDSALGLACGGFFPASAEVIKYLAEVNPDAREEKDSRMKTPLHNYFEACRFFSFDPYPEVVKMLATIDVVNTRDNRGRSPLYFLGRAARVVLPDSSLRQARNFQKSLDSILIDRPFNSTRFFNELRQLPKELRDHAFENHVVKLTLNDSMQRAPCTMILLCDIIFQAMIVVAFTFEITRADEASDLTTVLLVVGCIYWVLRRGASCLASNNRLLYIANVWRVLDLAHVVMLILSAVHLQQNPVQNIVGDHNCRNILIVTSCIVWLVFLSILRSSSKDFAVFVDAAIQITHKLISFIVASTTVLVMFATMFYLSAVQTDMCYDPTSTYRDGLNFCTLSASMLKVYALFVGSIEESQFVDVPTACLVLTSIYSFIVIILLLNIIIAIVTDAYQSLNKKAEHIFWQHRFAFLNEVDGLINFSFCRFYHTHWDGRTKSCHSSGLEIKDQHFFTQDRDDREREKDERFQRLTSSIHSVSNIADLLKLFVAAIVLFVWLGLGFLSLGYLWPSIVRKFIFCPRISGTYKDNDCKDKDQEDEMRGMKAELCAVTQKLDSMHLIMEQLLASQAAKQQDTFRHSSFT